MSDNQEPQPSARWQAITTPISWRARLVFFLVLLAISQVFWLGRGALGLGPVPVNPPGEGGPAPGQAMGQVAYLPASAKGFVANLHQVAQSLMLLDQEPDLAITPRQAGRILPLLTRGRQCWHDSARFQRTMAQVLTPYQAEFVKNHAGEKVLLPEGHTPQGEEPRIYAALEALKARASRAREPRAAPLSGPVIDLSLPDLAEGILRLETTTGMELTRDQAAVLFPALEDARKDYYGMFVATYAILGELTPPQTELVDRMGDEGPPGDPEVVLDEASAFLRARQDSRGKKS